MGKTRKVIEENIGIVLLLGGVLFLIMILGFIFSYLGPSNAGLDLTSATVTNETNLRLNASNPSTVAGAAYPGAGSFTITKIWGVQNGVYNVTIPTANGTISSNGSLTNATPPAYANVSVSYTFTYQGDAYYASSQIQNNSLVAFQEYSSNASGQFNIVAIVITICILVGLFLFVMGAVMVFGKKKESSGGGRKEGSPLSSKSDKNLMDSVMGSLFGGKGNSQNSTYA